MSDAKWSRVSRDRPCPVCDHPDWCLVARDGTAAICPRVESPRRVGEAGWLHRLGEGRGRRGGRAARAVSLTAGAGPGEDLARLARSYREAVDSARLWQLAGSLGLSVRALCQVGVGWSAGHRAWSFPMTDPAGNVRGVRLRGAGGAKFAVRGGKDGLFLPAAGDGEPARLMVCEGPTDTAALLDLGFPDVVGRPSCAGGVKLLVDLARRRRPREVVIVGDDDEPGRRGAERLASVLVGYVPAVRVIVPPAGVKDARAWLQAGATRQEVERIIEAATARRLKVRAVRTERGERGSCYRHRYPGVDAGGGQDEGDRAAGGGRGPHRLD